MMIIKILQILILVFLFVQFILAGTDGTIRGQIIDIKGDPVIGAQVVIKKISKGTAVGVDGNYLLLNVPIGTYDVTVQMIGYKTQITENVSITMDQTTWMNFTMEIAAIEGEVVYVTSERPLVEKGATSKKITMSKEQIASLPIRNVTELYNLQSGVVKVESRTQGIPDHEERGLDEVHVRGGRSGEIAYMIDGMYIRNPIYGGIGNGTRLNLYAIQEFDWQPGGFNAEYGDAMSAVSNFHTSSGSSEYTLKFKYETSLLGEALGSVYDELRNYHDYNFAFGGPLIPGFDKIKFWISAQSTDKGSFNVEKFDDIIYDDSYSNFYLLDLLAVRGDLDGFEELLSNYSLDPEWDYNKYNYTYPWDNTAGYKGFGFDRTDDYFAKLTFDLSSRFKINLSYWNVAAHQKRFSPETWLYWDEGKNEIFRDTERYAVEFNHTINTKTFYTIRLSRFQQDQFIGVRWDDSDGDGYPDWFEWGHQAGYSAYSDPKNPDSIPFKLNDDGTKVTYISQDGMGPSNNSSGWYYGAAPGNYNWTASDRYSDVNKNGYYDAGDILEEDFNGNGVWDPPPLVQASEFRDGSYWLTPEMYVDNEKFWDGSGAYLNYLGLHPNMTLDESWQFLNSYWAVNNPDQLPSAANSNPFDYYRPLYFNFWVEERAFGGHDKFYSTSTAITNEIRLDFTRQLTNRFRTRIGIDYKEHELNFYEVEEPWEDAAAIRQRFAEQWDDYGVDGVEWIDNTCQTTDYGEGNGVWDGPGTFENPCYDSSNPTMGQEFIDYPGEIYDDFNGNNKWDDFVEPQELAVYWQNTFEVPWMVVNAGIRVDAVNYQTKIWADPDGNFSPYYPWFWFDCGTDVDQLGNAICPDSQNDIEDDPLSGNGGFEPDPGEIVTDKISETNQYSRVIFKNADWIYNVSPRLGISHIISDGATFTFNYGVYYQTPIYEYIYRNVNQLEDPGQAFEDSGTSDSSIGNATMTAGRTTAYELAFNIELTKSMAVQAGIWVKDMDQLTTAKQYSSGIYEYKVAKNGDFGSALGFDMTLNLRGKALSATIQYTYSVAKASSEYDEKAFGEVIVDAPMQEFLMPYDRTHDLTLSFYTKKLPFGLNAGITGYYQSGYPYTALYTYAGGDKIAEDLKNKGGKRSPALATFDLSLSKDIKFGKSKVSVGVNVFNIFDNPYIIDVYYLSGKVDDPGSYYTDRVGVEVAGSYYDRPWMRSSNREINFFVEIGFN